jgi:hypothetical protein
VVKKCSLKKVKLLKKGKGFWSVIDVLGSIINHDEEMMSIMDCGHRHVISDEQIHTPSEKR